MAKKNALWTVMLYMNAEPQGFDECLKKNLSEIIPIGSTELVNIMILVDRNKPENAEKEKVYELPSIYRIEKDINITIETTPLHIIQNDSMGDPKVLKEFLSFCKNGYAAEKYLLLFWDHGTGTAVEAGTEEMLRNLDFFKESVGETIWNNLNYDIKNLLNPQSIHLRSTKRTISTLFKLIPQKVFIHSPEKKINQIQEEKVEENYLYVTEIEKTIKEVFGKDFLIDVIVFDSCWLQMFENAYTLRNCSKYIVASQNLIAIEGLGYYNFFKYIVQTPEADAKEISALMVKTSFLKVLEDTKFTLSSIDLKKVEIVALKIDTLSKIMLNNIETLFEYIRNARFLCLTYFDEESPSGYDLKVVDFIYFLKKLKAFLSINLVEISDLSNIKDVDTQKLFKGIIKICDDIITVVTLELISYKEIGLSMAEEKENDKRWGAHGFSIFFPEHLFEWYEYKNAEGFYYDVNGVPAMPFAKKNSWKKFLEKYFEYLEGGIK